jgi:hypothetical protein
MNMQGSNDFQNLESPEIIVHYPEQQIFRIVINRLIPNLNLCLKLL